MTQQLLTAEVDVLRSQVTGAVLRPDEPGYDAARRLWNGDFDRRPALVVRCQDTADVSAAVRFARQQGLEIAVRGGGHSASGQSAVDDGLMIDLSPMNQVQVDPHGRRAVVGGGATLADRDAATQAYGLAAPGGVVSHTGVGGLTLGGGMGWLARKAGLAVDNLLAAEVVTADGEVLRASESESPDLFWALRGGGGNFGVVTSFEFRLHEVGPEAQLALLYWELERGPQVLRMLRDVVSDLPRDIGVLAVGTSAPDAPFVPERHRSQPGYVLLLVGSEMRRSTAPQ